MLLNEIKKQRLEEVEKYYSEFACMDEQAIIINEDLLPENVDDTDVRTNFRRDIDKVRYLKAYSRYRDKAQVFWWVENDHIAKRALHVLDVSEIAGVIAHNLKLNEELARAGGTAHDLGHTPFGHAGERHLDKICREIDKGYFTHNAQGVRVLTKFEKFPICLQVVDAVLSHNGATISPRFETNPNKSIQTVLEETNNCFQIEDYNRNIRAMTLEGVIVRVSDFIAYLGRDIEDAILIGMLKREDLPQTATRILGNNNSDIVNTVVSDVIINSYGKPYIKFSHDIYQALEELKDFNNSQLYSKKRDKENLLEEPFRKMFQIYCQMLSDERNLIRRGLTGEYLEEEKGLLSFLIDSDDEYWETTDVQRKVIDYMAGQTDRYFMRECELNISGFNKKEIYAKEVFKKEDDELLSEI